MAAAKKTRKKNSKRVEKGCVHIQSSFNNTIVTITDTQGNTISWSSSEARRRALRSQLRWLQRTRLRLLKTAA